MADDMPRGSLFMLDQADRDFMDTHYRVIAERLHAKGLFRAPWRVDLGDSVYKFTVNGFERPKKGQP